MDDKHRSEEQPPTEVTTPPEDGELRVEGEDLWIGDRQLTSRQMAVLVAATFSAGLCSIVYELLIGTASSYFLGDSVQQFSLTIGVFMAAMGLGSFFSRRVGDNALRVFVIVEVCLGVLGGASIPLLYAVYAYTNLYSVAMISLIVAIGVLTGLEIPLLVLVMRRCYSLKDNLSNILSLDYFGALAATLLFPFVLLPFLGTFRSSLATGVLNLAVAGLMLVVFREHIEESTHRRWTVATAGVVGALVITFILSPYLLRPWHNAVYEDRVILARQSSYQKIVMTRSRDDIRMFLNGNLQFSTIDEHRYHEALVHPAMAAAPHRGNVLILGGGDGLVIREVLKYDDVDSVTLVELDPAITRLAREHPVLRKINEESLTSPKVDVVHQDAFVFLKENSDLYDIIIADLPDPNNASLARLYSLQFYHLIGTRLARSGVLVTQATSPFFARRAFWCIHATVREAGFKTHPYHAYVPSFGDWGFVMAARFPVDPEQLHVTVPTQYLDEETLDQLFIFGKDIRESGLKVSTLDDPEVLSYYLKGWRHW